MSIEQLEPRKKKIFEKPKEKPKSESERAEEEKLFRSALLSVGQKPIANEIVVLTRKWLHLVDKDNSLSPALQERLKKFERWEALTDRPKAFREFLELVSDAALDRYVLGGHGGGIKEEGTYEELIEYGLEMAMKALSNNKELFVDPQLRPRIELALAAFRDEMLASRNRAK